MAKKTSCRSFQVTKLCRLPPKKFLQNQACLLITALILISQWGLPGQCPFGRRLLLPVNRRPRPHPWNWKSVGLFRHKLSRLRRRRSSVQPTGVKYCNISFQFSLTAGQGKILGPLAEWFHHFQTVLTLKFVKWRISSFSPIFSKLKAN